MINNNNPYLRNKTPTLVTLSAAAIALVLLTSPMLFFNILLQPVQATQTPMTFKTPKPANINDGSAATLTFDAQGMGGTISSGTFQITDTSSGQTLYNGSIHAGGFQNSTDGGTINAFGDLDYPAGGGTFGISTSCSASTNNDIQVGVADYNDVFQGVVTCSVGEVNAIAQPSSSPPSSSLTGSSQGTDRGNASSSNSSTDSNSGSSSSSSSNSKDGDRDGVPDSSDRCTHNSNPRCFKEGGDTSTSATTTQQEQPSSSNRTGNQTR